MMKIRDMVHKEFIDHFDARQKPVIDLDVDGNRKVVEYFCPICKTVHFRRFLLSASSLKVFADCKRQWFYRKILKPKTKHTKMIYIRSGHLIHKVEELFWNAMKEKGQELFTPPLMRSIGSHDLADLILKVKMRNLTPMKADQYRPWIRNLSMIDAIRWRELMGHFGDDLEQAWKYWVPLEMELEKRNFTLGTKYVIDRLMLIPAGFKNYENEKDVLLVGDYKPGKLDENGRPKPLEKISDYSFGTFKQQLVLYALSLDLEKAQNREIYIGGIFYKTGLMLVEKLHGRSISAVLARIRQYWECEEFPRNISTKYRCAWCDYRLSCLNTRELLGGDDSNADNIILTPTSRDWSVSGVVFDK